jgi:hypothetical protein
VNTPLVRVNITLPKDIVEEAKKRGGVSKTATEAIRELLAREKRVKAMKEILAGPPAFPEIENASEYIHTMRQEEGKKRDKKLGFI